MEEMSPYRQAIAYYGDELATVIACFLNCGHVVSGPDCLIFAREVPRGAPQDLIDDPWHVFEPEECDTWLIWYASGTLEAILNRIPWTHKYLAYDKYGVLRWRELQPLLDRFRVQPDHKEDGKTCQSAEAQPKKRAPGDASSPGSTESSEPETFRSAHLRAQTLAI